MATETFPVPHHRRFKRPGRFAVGLAAVAAAAGAGVAVTQTGGSEASRTKAPEADIYVENRERVKDSKTNTTTQPTLKPTNESQTERLLKSEYWTARPPLITGATPEERVTQTLALLEYCWNTGLGCDALAENGLGVHQSVVAQARRFADRRISDGTPLSPAVKLSLSPNSPIKVVTATGNFETLEARFAIEDGYLDLVENGRPTPAHPGTTEAELYRIRLEYNAGIQAWQLDCLDTLVDDENLAC